MPSTKNAGKARLHLGAIRPARANNDRYRMSTTMPPTNPVSSTMMEYTKSDEASGKRLASRELPGMTPKKPPLARAM